MAYLRTVTATQTFSKQDNSTLALPPADRLSTLGRVDSEKRVNNQVRLMMQNKKSPHGIIKRGTVPLSCPPFAHFDKPFYPL